MECVRSCKDTLIKPSHSFGGAMQTKHGSAFYLALCAITSLPELAQILHQVSQLLLVHRGR